MNSDRRKEKQAIGPRISLPGRWRSWYAAKRPVLIFGAKFGALIVLFYGLLATSFFDRGLYSYLRANAWLANGILNALGQASHVTDVIIASPRFSMAIRRGCDAVEPTWLFCAALMAFPAAPMRKLWGMASGVVVLQLLNLIRIVSLYWIGIYWPGSFNSVHLEIWPALFILAALLLFVGWRKWAAPPNEFHGA